jgi:hypothetical protein
VEEPDDDYDDEETVEGEGLWLDREKQYYLQKPPSCSMNSKYLYQQEMRGITT